jgi:hypothetical protein
MGHVVKKHIKQENSNGLSAPILKLWLQGTLILNVIFKRSCYSSMSKLVIRAWDVTSDAEFGEFIIFKFKSVSEKYFKKPTQSDRGSMCKK